jgi:hypothetical protein
MIEPSAMARAKSGESRYGEEEQVEKVEDFLRANTSLTGTPLENAVLDILWRHRKNGPREFCIHEVLPGLVPKVE